MHTQDVPPGLVRSSRPSFPVSQLLLLLGLEEGGRRAYVTPNLRRAGGTSYLMLLVPRPADCRLDWPLARRVLHTLRRGSPAAPLFVRLSLFALVGQVDAGTADGVSIMLAE